MKKVQQLTTNGKLAKVEKTEVQAAWDRPLSKPAAGSQLLILFSSKTTIGAGLCWFVEAITSIQNIVTLRNKTDNHCQKNVIHSPTETVLFKLIACIGSGGGL